MLLARLLLDEISHNPHCTWSSFPPRPPAFNVVVRACCGVRSCGNIAGRRVREDALVFGDAIFPRTPIHSRTHPTPATSPGMAKEHGTKTVGAHSKLEAGTQSLQSSIGDSPVLRAQAEPPEGGPRSITGPAPLAGGARSLPSGDRPEKLDYRPDENKEAMLV